MIQLHHLNNSRSQRLLWMLEELGCDYDIIEHQRHPVTQLAPDSLKAVHPLGKAPILTDNASGETVTFVESGAIVEYLRDQYGQSTWQFPVDSEERQEERFWLHYAEGSIMPLLLMKLFFTKIREAKMPFFAKPIAGKIADNVEGSYIHPNLATHFDYIESRLQDRQWLVGDQLSAADIMMIFPLEAGLSRQISAESHPNIATYVRRIHERKAYQRALECSADYAYASKL